MKCGCSKSSGRQICLCSTRELFISQLFLVSKTADHLLLPDRNLETSMRFHSIPLRLLLHLAWIMNHASIRLILGAGFDGLCNVPAPDVDCQQSASFVPPTFYQRLYLAPQLYPAPLRCQCCNLTKRPRLSLSTSPPKVIKIHTPPNPVACPNT